MVDEQRWHDDIPDGKVIPGEVTDWWWGDRCVSFLGGVSGAEAFRMRAIFAGALLDPRSLIDIAGGAS